MKRKWKRTLSIVLSVAMLFSMTGMNTVFALEGGPAIGASGLCEHHKEHTADCGYTEGTPGTPCTHEHTDECYREATDCTHTHTDECYGDEIPTATDSGAVEPVNCAHICDEESGCVAEELDCQHEHDGDCGYTEGTPGTPCAFVCGECANDKVNGGEADRDDCLDHSGQPGPTPTSCTRTDGCTLEDGHEGDCDGAVTASPLAVPAASDTYAVTLNIYMDNVAETGSYSNTFTLKLKDNKATTVQMTDTGATRTASVPNGIWEVHMAGGGYTGVDITVNGGAVTGRFDQYSLSPSISYTGTVNSATLSATVTGPGGESGEISAASNTVFFRGDKVVFTATGEGADSYTYEWSGTHGDSPITGTGQTLTIDAVEGKIELAVTLTGGASTTVTTAEALKTALEADTPATISVTENIAGLGGSYTVGADHTLEIADGKTVSTGNNTLTIPVGKTLTLTGTGTLEISATDTSKITIFVLGTLKLSSGSRLVVANSGQSSIGVSLSTPLSDASGILESDGGIITISNSGETSSGISGLIDRNSATLTLTGGNLTVENTAGYGIDSVKNVTIAGGCNLTLANEGTNISGIQLDEVSVKESTVNIINTVGNGLRIEELTMDGCTVTVANSGGNGIDMLPRWEGGAFNLKDSTLTLKNTGGTGLNIGSHKKLIIDNATVTMEATAPSGGRALWVSAIDASVVGMDSETLTLVEGVILNLGGTEIFSDRGSVYHGRDDVTVTAENGPATNKTLTAGDYIWDGTYFTKKSDATWNGDGGLINIADGDTVAITNTATGTLAIPAGATVTIVGTVTDAKPVSLNLGAGAKVIWAASYTGSCDNGPLVRTSGSITSTIEITGAIINTGTTNAAAISVSGDAVVTGGTVSGQLYGVYAENVTINTRSTITSTSDAAIQATNDVIINGGTITGGSKNGNAAMVVYNGSITLAGGMIIANPGARAVSSGTITVTGNVAIHGTVGGTDSWPATITVNAGGTLTVPQSGTLIVNNTGTITNNGVIVNDGTIVNNGTITNHSGSTYTGATPTGTGTFTPPPSSDTYALTVTDGTGGGSYAEGATVTITANAAPDGQRFKEWSISPEVTFAEGTSKASQTAKFTMPAQAVNATAAYESIPAGATAVTGVTLNKSSLSLYSNSTPNTAALTATVSPADATDKTMTWASGNTAVATVDQNGKVTAVGNGTATITVTTTDGGYTASCTVSVSTYTSSGGSGGGGGGSSSSGGTTTATPTDPGKPDTATNAETKVTPTVDANGSAIVTVPEKSITDAIKAAQDAAKKAGTEKNGVSVTIDATTGKGASDMTATLTEQSVDALIKAGVIQVQIKGDAVSITLGLPALKAAQATAGGAITVSAKPVAANTLSAAAQNAIGNRPVFSFTLQSGGKPVSNFGGGSAAIAIPYTPQKGEDTGKLCVVYVDDNGGVTYLTDSSYDPNAKALIARTGHFSVYGVSYKADAPVFTDTADHWAKDDIDFVTARGLLSGTGNNQFSPNTDMTRGMFVTALGRLAGIDPAGYKTGKFTDVKAEAYYAPYVNWAAEKGIVSGTTATTFTPDNAVTRQEMAVIMANYAKALGYTVPKTREAVTFADNSSIASWAKDAAKAMQMAGIIGGKDGNRFDPTGNATRAEVAAVLHRYVELVIDPATAQGWTQNDAGQWLYYENGKPVTGWKRVDGKWYYLDTAGIMQSGGWKQIGGKWYYLCADGSMAVSTKIDGYEVGPDGGRKESQSV